MTPETPAAEHTPEHRARIIREQNDLFRQSFVGGRIMMTSGVQALDEDTKISALRLIRAFDDFTKDNDPWNEHDFGEVKIGHQRIWFKIDAYDKDLQYGSPDPTDPDVTTRVMTILLPEEY